MPINRPDEFHRIFGDAFNSGDKPALLDMYEEDAALALGPGDEARGRDTIGAALDRFLALNGKMTLQTTYVIEAARLALLRSHWHLEGTGPDGKPVTMEGDSLEVLRRQPNGTWRVAIDHPFGAGAM